MIYVVKCFYCEEEFRVKRGETGADIMCPACGKANSIRNVIERIEEEKKEDLDLQTIKGFDMTLNPVRDDYWDRVKRRRQQKLIGELIGGAVLFIVLLIMSFLKFIKVI